MELWFTYRDALARFQPGREMSLLGFLLLVLGVGAGGRADAVERALGLRPGCLLGEVRIAVMIRLYWYVRDLRGAEAGAWNLPPCAGIGGPDKVQMKNGWWPQSVVALCEHLGAPRVLRARLMRRVGRSGFASARTGVPTPRGRDPPGLCTLLIG